MIIDTTAPLPSSAPAPAACVPPARWEPLADILVWAGLAGGLLASLLAGDHRLSYVFGCAALGRQGVRFLGTWEWRPGDGPPDEPRFAPATPGAPSAFVRRQAFLSVRVAAARSGMSTDVVKAMCRSGLVRAARVDGYWYVHHDDFTPWMHDDREDRSQDAPAGRPGPLRHEQPYDPAEHEDRDG